MAIVSSKSECWYYWNYVWKWKH